MSGTAMEIQILTLLMDAAKLTDAGGKPDPTQASAVSCGVILRNGPMLQGSLSTVEHRSEPGNERHVLLRMLQLTPDPKGGPPQAVEAFFEFADVVAIAVEREVKASGPTLFSA